MGKLDNRKIRKSKNQNIRDSENQKTEKQKEKYEY